MKKTFHFGTKNTTSAKEFRVNEKIFSRELMVINELGENMGLMPTAQALTEAQNRGLDLVEVSPKANPPIAKIMNYGSYKYQKEKMERKARSKTKTIEIKTVKISTRISPHDMEFRAGQAIKFLAGGDKVKIELQLRGREHQHADLGRENIKKLINDISQGMSGKTVKIEMSMKQLGSKISTIITL